MSGMAKIFVVVNLILVTAVWGSAATLLGAQDDYRAALKEATEKAAEVQSKQQQELKDADLKVQTQTAMAVKHLSAAEDAEQRRAIAEANLNSATQVNQQLTAANERLSANIEALRKQIETQQATVSAAQTEAQAANGKFQDAHKQLEEESRNRAALEARVQELDDTNRTLQAQSQDYAKKIRELEFELEQARKAGWQGLKAGTGAPGVVLEVQSVAGGGLILIISVGSDDGVRVGDEYKFSRGEKFVGFGRVTRVYKDKAVVEFDVNNTGSGAPPQVQDRAYVN